ncbi:hypothetical protein [Enemella evansiae]|uniref:hypothetical protein n=1 Tax=Enemella evansiae TaxID=2016499 RepID=UPI000B965E34|nr:hypothetical protein [Enemella evansiae]OYO03864.1 hypothetical protein CGZ97_10705 [Enemella evansiae]TDO86297.1 hypothetical protein C8D81_3674 [Enemella evansiae]
MLEIEPGAKVVEATCEHCGEPMTRVTGFIYRDGDAYAIYFASCYHHDGHEVWIDAVFSPTWADDVDDRFTFGCRVGAVAGQREPAASLVTAAGAFNDSATFGHKLTREEALAHPMTGEFWALVDHVLTKDAVVSTHLYGPDAQFE